MEKDDGEKYHGPFSFFNSPYRFSKHHDLVHSTVPDFATNVNVSVGTLDEIWTSWTLNTVSACASGTYLHQFLSCQHARTCPSFRSFFLCLPTDQRPCSATCEPHTHSTSLCHFIIPHLYSKETEKWLDATLLPYTLNMWEAGSSETYLSTKPYGRHIQEDRNLKFTDMITSYRLNIFKYKMWWNCLIQRDAGVNTNMLLNP
jgi:hypothetical protein